MPEKGLFATLKPILVLVGICIVISGLLAGVNAITAPIIEAADLKAMENTLQQLLPNATSFTKLDCDLDSVVAVYKDDGGSGYAIVTIGKGYKGDITVTTALDPDGVILGVSADASGETAGVGTKTGQPDFTNRFAGLQNSAESVDIIAGATISSKAVKAAVETALEAYRAVQEGAQ